MKKTIAWILAAVMLLALTACSTDKPADNGRVVGTAYPDEQVGFQTEMPETGDTVACMHTSMGDIYLRFFPEAAPKAVENFLTHARNGYFDGLTFHRVINDFMIQSGDPEGNGTGGESIWGTDFEDEFDQKLLNIRGALSMANAGAGTNGSQFFINQKGPDGQTAEQLKATYDYDTMYAAYSNYYKQYVDYYGASFTAYYPDVDSFIENYVGGIVPVSTKVYDEAWALYAQYGGNISLDGAFRNKGGHTVFGQVYQGMEVVDAIAAVETDDNDKPTTPVTITSVDVFAYVAE